MYAQPQSGATVAAVAPTLHVGTYRRNLLAVLVGNDLFSADEQQRAQGNVGACQDATRLALWLKNVRRVAAEREQARTLAAMAHGIARFEARVALAAPAATPNQYEVAQAAYKQAAAKARRLTVRRNELFEQLCPLRPDGFPVYAYAENPNRAQLEAAHAAALEANRLALVAQERVQQLEPQATAAPRYATPNQCDELYRLACHPALTPAEKAQTLALLPTLTEGAAVACIGQLYAQVLRRAGQLGWRDGSTLLAA